MTHLMSPTWRKKYYFDPLFFTPLSLIAVFCRHFPPSHVTRQNNVSVFFLLLADYFTILFVLCTQIFHLKQIKTSGRLSLALLVIITKVFFPNFTLQLPYNHVLIKYSVKRAVSKMYHKTKKF